MYAGHVKVEVINIIDTRHSTHIKLTGSEKLLILIQHVPVIFRLLEMVKRNPSLKLDVNCKDPVGRSATLMAIDNENLEMLELLLDNGVESRDALLHAINAEYVEAVDLLLEHEEMVHKEGEPHVSYFFLIEYSNERRLE